MSRYRVPVSEIRNIVDPLLGETWKCAPIAIAEVQTAVEQQKFRSESWNAVQQSVAPEQARDFHIHRIAYLVHHGYDQEAPKIAVAHDGVRTWIYDGNHRVAAAIIRGDAALDIVLADTGDGALQKLLPSATLLL